MPKIASKLVTKLTSKTLKKVSDSTRKREPLWQGPESDNSNGGVTQSMLSAFLCCRERFRIKYVEGLQPEDSFGKSLEFGNMWHVCEEEFAKEPEGTKATNRWQQPLLNYCQDLCKRYRTQQEDVEKWYNVVKRLFPVYVDHWRKHPDVKKRTPLLQEYVFCVPYKPPSGRTVYLKGKFDSVDLVGKIEIWLMENKTKSDIDQNDVEQRLSFDLQTMLYLVALQQIHDWDETVEFPANSKIVGVRYNVIRRPFAGGKGSIRPHQPTKSRPQGETMEAFYQRFLDDYVYPEPEYWFSRWNVTVSQNDIERYKREFLNPVLEQLCDWYQWVTLHADPFTPYESGDSMSSPHFRLPFGVYNSIMETGGSDLDAYLKTGSEVGLTRVNSLFGELK